MPGGRDGAPIEEDFLCYKGRHQKNIARIAKRCPEDIASVVKCVKFFLPKVLRKY